MSTRTHAPWILGPLVVVVVTSGCLFAPNIEAEGYTACAADGDCAAGRICEASLCAPPPWNDEAFSTRQLLTVDNTADTPLTAGTAVPVVVGAGGVLDLAAVGVEGRYTDFNVGARRWDLRPVYRDLFDDRFVVWIPLARDIPAGSRGVLAWVESDTEADQPTLLEQPADVFAPFDDFLGSSVSDAWFVQAPSATPPPVREGLVTVGDNTKLVHLTPLSLPFVLTFKARINGVTCDEVFLGATASDNQSFDPPSVGFFVGDDLDAVAEIAPDEDAVPTPVATPARLDNATHRYTIEASATQARFFIDDTLFAETETLRPGFSDAPLFITAEVGGACSLDIDAVWASPLPLPAPQVVADPIVTLDRFQ